MTSRKLILFYLVAVFALAGCRLPTLPTVTQTATFPPSPTAALATPAPVTPTATVTPPAAAGEPRGLP